ncbi:10841_t:CDS:2, partial [Cetraspora pellucida]
PANLPPFFEFSLLSTFLLLPTLPQKNLPQTFISTSKLIYAELDTNTTHPTQQTTYTLALQFSTLSPSWGSEVSNTLAVDWALQVWSLLGGPSLEDTEPNGCRFAGPWSFFPFIQTLCESLSPGIEKSLSPP